MKAIDPRLRHRRFHLFGHPGPALWSLARTRVAKGRIYMTSDKLLFSERFPRSAKYHPEWVLASVSGPANALWLSEWLAAALDLRPGMRVLDLGCGRAASSIFLRREFGTQVWATDLWFSAWENLQRIRGSISVGRLWQSVPELKLAAVHLVCADGVRDAESVPVAESRSLERPRLLTRTGIGLAPETSALLLRAPGIPSRPAPAAAPGPAR